MNDAVIDLFDQMAALWRLRWWAVAVAWVICCIGWIGVLALPDVYQSSARVIVDTKSALKPILQGIAVEQDVGAEVNRVEQSLLSRPQLEEIAHRTKLDARVRDPSDMDNVVFDLRQALTIVATQSRDAGDSLYTITYRNHDRDQSLAVVQTLLDSFIGDTLGGNQAGSESGQKFLREQIDEYEHRLSDAEARLAEFKRSNEGLIPGQKGDYFSRLSAEVDANQKSQTELSVAISRRAELHRQMSDVASVVPAAPVGGANGALPLDLPSRIQESEARLQDLLLRYTDRHPEVVALRDTIAGLKRQEADELRALAHGGPGSAFRSLAANPVRQTIMLQLNQTDVEIAALRGAVKQHELEIARLRTFVDTAPEVEQRFATLNRDYDVTKVQYAALVERLEKARISENADRTGVVRFRVIDPPAAAMEPVAPNRPMLIFVVLALGAASGLGVAFVVQRFKPVFGSVQVLRRVTGLPVLGAIVAVVNERDAVARSRDTRRFAASFGALVIACGLLFMIQERAAAVVHALLTGAMFQ